MVNLLLSHHQARQETQRVRARRNHQQAPLPGSFHNRRWVLGELQAEDEAAAARLGDELGEFSLELGEAVLEDL